jgi:hypothetical protein
VSGIIAGALGFECVGRKLTAPDVCDSPLPKSLARAIGKNLKKAQKAVAKAENLIAQNAAEKKITAQTKKMAKFLSAIGKSIGKTETTKNEKNRISLACASTLRLLTQQQGAVVAGLGR